MEGAAEYLPFQDSSHELLLFLVGRSSHPRMRMGKVALETRWLRSTCTCLMGLPHLPDLETKRVRLQPALTGKTFPPKNSHGYTLQADWTPKAAFRPLAPVIPVIHRIQSPPRVLRERGNDPEKSQPTGESPQRFLPDGSLQPWMLGRGGHPVPRAPGLGRLRPPRAALQRLLQGHRGDLF